MERLRESLALNLSSETALSKEDDIEDCAELESESPDGRCTDY